MHPPLLSLVTPLRSFSSLSTTLYANLNEYLKHHRLPTHASTLHLSRIVTIRALKPTIQEEEDTSSDTF